MIIGLGFRDYTGMYTGFGFQGLGFGVKPQGQGLRLWGLGGLRRLRLLLLLLLTVADVIAATARPCACRYAGRSSI